MFDDILGRYKEKVISKGSVGDAKTESFAEVWARNQRKINEYDDDDEDEYEGLQLDEFDI